jgi:hypothetical protein
VIGSNRSTHRSDRHRRVRLGDRRDEVSRGDRLVPLPRQQLPHRGRRRSDARGGERRADQGAQPPVPVAGLVEDVRVDLLAQPPARDAEQVGDLPPRKRRRP